jgi:hypothetical protein
MFDDFPTKDARILDSPTTLMNSILVKVSQAGWRPNLEASWNQTKVQKTAIGIFVVLVRELIESGIGTGRRLQ